MLCITGANGTLGSEVIRQLESAGVPLRAAHFSPGGAEAARAQGRNVAIIDYANTRGADKVIYAGYFPMGLSIERIMTEMPNVGFKDDVWPKFLRTNALRVLGLDG